MMFCRTSLFGCLVLAVAFPAAAQSPLELAARYPGALMRLDQRGALTFFRDPNAPSYAGNAEEVARAYLAELGAFLGEEPLGEPLVSEVAGRSLVHFPAEIGGVPVFGRGVTVAVAPSGRPALLLRAPLPSLVSPRRLTPTLDEGEARALGAAAAGHSSAAQGMSRLVILPVARQNLLAYEVITHEGFSTKRVFLDAETGRTIFSQDITYDALARVYDANPGANIDLPLIEVELPPILEASEENGLVGDFVNSLNCSSQITNGACTPFGNAFPDEAGDLLFDPVLNSFDPLFREDPFAQVHMFFHVDRIHSFFQALGATDEPGQIFTPDFQGVTTLDSPLPAFTNVRFDFNGNGVLDSQDAFDNAFFDGSAIVFGDGSTRDFSYDAEVIYHEYAHGVISFKLAGFDIDELGLDLTNSGINEGTADIFSILFFNDPELGEYIVGRESGLRNLDNNLLYPFDLDAESHDDGEIWAGAFWEIKERMEAEFGEELGEEVVRDFMARVYIATILSLPFNSSADFGEAGLVAISFAEELGDELGIGAEASALFLDVYQERGILDAEGAPARRIVPLEHPEALARDGFIQFFFGQETFGLGGDRFVPGTIQYSVTLEPGKELRANFSAFSFVAGFPNASFKLFVREDQPVTFNIVQNSFFEATADRVLEDDPAQNGLRLSLSNFEDEPKTFFLAFGFDNRRDGIAVVDSISINDVPDFIGGGGCAVSGGDGGGLWGFGLAFLLLLLYRGRSRRRS